jgi:hypothetical protein
LLPFTGLKVLFLKKTGSSEPAFFMRQTLQNQYNKKICKSCNFSAHFGRINKSELIEADSAKINSARGSVERTVSDSKTGYNVSQISY